MIKYFRSGWDLELSSKEFLESIQVRINDKVRHEIFFAFCCYYRPPLMNTLIVFSPPPHISPSSFPVKIPNAAHLLRFDQKPIKTHQGLIYETF